MKVNSGGDENGVHDLSCLCNEVSIKPPKVPGAASFPAGEHMEVLE